MSTHPTYPGVYIQEIPSGVRTIAGVSTSIAAFIGYFKRGPMNKAVQIFSLGDFDREFGGLYSQSEASYAIQQFFLNGGTQAFAIRVASGSPNASNVTIADSPGGSEALRLKAINEGEWGDNIRVSVNHNRTVDDEFNMVITEYSEGNTIVRQESWLNLSMVDGATNNVETVLNDENSGSQIIQVDNVNGTNPPAANGTITGLHSGGNITFSSIVAFQVSVNGGANKTVTLPLSDGISHSLSIVSSALEDAIRASDPLDSILSGATVNVMGERLQILAGTDATDTILSFSGGGDTFNELGLNTSVENLQEYSLGGEEITGTAQLSNSDGAAEEGNNGGLPDNMALIGSINTKTGIHALEDVDMFNIMCIPRTGIVTGTNAMTEVAANNAIDKAIKYCIDKRAFFIIDTPSNISDRPGIQNWMISNKIRTINAALYFPRVMIPDPLDNYRLRSVGASGTIAGLYARIDSNRGVWKAPAGTEASLRGVSKLEYKLTDREHGVLNPLGINGLRNFPVYGTICWGARTLDGADALASEWKYIPVRRLALFLEESLYRGTHWVVFEPNDEPLWAQIRLNVGAFMNNLFKQGAFQGTTPREAYLVKCDRETTTQNDINQGIVNIVVGFAPLKPAEFVFIKIKQLAGQIES